MQAYIEKNLPAVVDDHNRLEKQEIAQSVSDRLEADEIKDVFQAAGTAALLAAPVVTASGIAMIFSPGSSGSRIDLSGCIRMLGVPVAVGGIVVDAVKLPVATAFSLGALLYGAGRWIKSLVFRPDHTASQKREIMESAAQRFANTCQLLVSMKLETRSSILEKINQFVDASNKKETGSTDGMAMLCGFTALNTAFASRRLGENCILLANGKVLFRKKCPSQGRSFFDSVLHLRDIIRSAGLGPKSNAEATFLIMHWIPLLKSLVESQFSNSNDKRVKIGSDHPLLQAIPIEQRVMFASLVNAIYAASRSAIGASQLDKNKYAMWNAAYDSTRDVPVLSGDVPFPPPNSCSSASSSSSSSSSSSLPPVEKVKQDPTRKMFVDSFDLQPICSNAIIGKDGLIYDATRASLRKIQGIILYACRDEVSSSLVYWHGHEDLSVDPITCSDILEPVVANDGFIYDVSTFDFMKQRQLVGCGGVVLESHIPCRLSEWPTTLHCG